MPVSSAPQGKNGPGTGRLLGKTHPSAEKRLGTGRTAPRHIPGSARQPPLQTLPSETRQNSASRHQKGRNPPPCAHSLSEPFSPFPRTFSDFAGKGLPAAFCALQGVKKSDLRREKALPQAQKRQRAGFPEGGAVPCPAPSVSHPAARQSARTAAGKTEKAVRRPFCSVAGKKKRRPPERDRRFPTEKRARRRPGPEGRGRNRAHRRGADLPFFPRAR